MSFTFSKVGHGTVIEHTVLDEDCTWDELLEQFEYFLKGCGYSFKEGFVGFEAKYQEDYDNNQLEFDFLDKKAAKA